MDASGNFKPRFSATTDLPKKDAPAGLTRSQKTIDSNKSKIHSYLTKSPNSTFNLRKLAKPYKKF